MQRCIGKLPTTTSWHCQGPARFDSHALLRCARNDSVSQQQEEHTMDLGLKGKKAIVCAASKGLGRACAMSLAREGVDVVITARTASDLEATAADIRKETGANVTAVA